MTLPAIAAELDRSKEMIRLRIRKALKAIRKDLDGKGHKQLAATK